MEKLSSLLNVKVELLENELQKANVSNPLLKQYGGIQEDETKINSLKNREDILSEKILGLYLQNQEVLKEIVIEHIPYFPVSFANILKLIKNDTINTVLENKEAINTDVEISEEDLKLLDYLYLLGSRDLEDDSKVDLGKIQEEGSSCA